MDKDQWPEAANDKGFDRRTLLKRGAVVGGAAVWATPVVQSLAQPAFAAGSVICVNSFRFKYELLEGGGGRFSNGVPDPGSTAASCLPADFATTTDTVGDDGSIPGHSGSVVITLVDGSKALISLPAECILLDGNAKAGGKDNLECEQASFVGRIDGRNVYQVDLVKDISFVGGVICCS